MKKAFIRLVLRLFIILVVFSIVFAVGYIQFYVPLGKYGVFVSKTSGYHKHLITHEGFLWRWEKLIPTNSELLLFDLAPITLRKTLQGKLENADRYAVFLKNEPNFSWSVDINVRFDIEKKGLIELLKETNTRDESSFLNAITKDSENALVNAIEDAILFYQDNDTKCNTFLFREYLKKQIKNTTPKVLKCEILSIDVVLPDFIAYKSARDVAIEYARVKQDILLQKNREAKNYTK